MPSDSQPLLCTDIKGLLEKAARGLWLQLVIQTGCSCDGAATRAEAAVDALLKALYAAALLERQSNVHELQKMVEALQADTQPHDLESSLAYEAGIRALQAAGLRLASKTIAEQPERALEIERLARKMAGGGDDGDEPSNFTM